MSFRLTFQHNHDPRGPDGQGWNRIAIINLEPTDRCALRPKTRQAAIDTARGMARFGVITAYSDCEFPQCDDCDNCPIGGEEKREEWQSNWLVIEGRDGEVWLHGNLSPSGFGYRYQSWEALLRAVEVPMLERRHDDHWGFYYMEAGGAA